MRKLSIIARIVAAIAILTWVTDDMWECCNPYYPPLPAQDGMDSTIYPGDAYDTTTWDTCHIGTVADTINQLHPSKAGWDTIQSNVIKSKPAIFRGADGGSYNVLIGYHAGMYIYPGSYNIIVTDHDTCTRDRSFAFDVDFDHLWFVVHPDMKAYLFSLKDSFTLHPDLLTDTAFRRTAAMNIVAIIHKCANDR